MQLTSPVQLHPSPVTSLPDEPEVIERRLLLCLGSKILTVLLGHGKAGAACKSNRWDSTRCSGAHDPASVDVVLELLHCVE